MIDFDFPAWRRELEQAIARGEAIPIRVLLDQTEAAVADLEACLQEACDPGEPE